MGIFKKAFGAAKKVSPIAAPLSALGIAGLAKGLGSDLMGKNLGLGEGEEDLKRLAMANYGLALSELRRDVLDPERSAKGLAGLITSREQGAQRTATEDAIRSLRQNIAQRGLGASSIGLRAETGLQREAAEKIADIGAFAPLREDEIRRQRIQALLGASAPAAQFAQSFKSRRKPGLITPLLAAAGGVAGSIALPGLGGAAGSQIGAGIGSGIEGAYGG